MHQTPDWIAVDWGTTHLRAYGMGADQRLLVQAQSAQGMGSLKDDEFEAALLALLQPWLPARGCVPVFCCGMVGARQGWLEAPYAAVPCRPGAIDSSIAVATVDTRLEVHIVAGLSQAEPADVMRGEETQLLGLLASGDGAADVVCLPGTHSKWVALEGDTVQKFQTFMTGEVFALLSQQSLLRHSLAAESETKNEWHEDAFGVGSALYRPGKTLEDIAADAGLFAQAYHAIR